MKRRQAKGGNKWLEKVGQRNREVLKGGEKIKRALERRQERKKGTWRDWNETWGKVNKEVTSKLDRRKRRGRGRGRGNDKFPEV